VRLLRKVLQKGLWPVGSDLQRRFGAKSGGRQPLGYEWGVYINSGGNKGVKKQLLEGVQ